MTRPHKFRFHLDENFPASAWKFLRSLGHNVTLTQTVEHGSLQGKSDSVQLRFAIKEERVFLTYDRDFHQGHLARLIEQSPGVITVRGEITEKLIVKLLRELGRNSPTGRLLRASVDQITVVTPAK